MRKKKGNLELIIVGIIIILSVGYLVLRKTDKIHYSVPVLKSIDVESFSKIILTKSDRSIVLDRKGTEWRIGEAGYRSDKDKTDKISALISNLILRTLVSKSENYFKYELDEERKINVKVFRGDKIIREFDVGKTASTYNHTYVKISGDPDIYYSSGSIRSDLDKSVDELRDKKVFSIGKDEVTEINFLNKGKSFTLIRSFEFTKKKVSSKESGIKSDEREIVWTFNGNKVEVSKVNSFLDQVSEITCDKFLYNSEISGSEPLYIIRMGKDPENIIKIYEAVEKEDNDYPAESSQTEYPFILKGYKTDNLIKPLKAIFEIK